jgi:hypothetical protein
MRRLLTVIAGGFGIVALWRTLRRRRPHAPQLDPAEELRRKLAEAREADDDRDEFDAAQGTPIDQVEPVSTAEGGGSGSVEERRRAVHQQAEEALGRMQKDAED